MPLIARSLSGNLTKALQSSKRHPGATDNRDPIEYASVVQDYSAGSKCELSVVKGQRVEIIPDDSSSCFVGNGEDHQHASGQWCCVRLLQPQADETNGSAEVPDITGSAELQPRQRGYVPASAIQLLDPDDESQHCGVDGGCNNAHCGATPPNNLGISKMFPAGLRKLFPVKVTAKKSPKIKYDRSATVATFYDGVARPEDTPAVGCSEECSASAAAAAAVGSSPTSPGRSTPGLVPSQNGTDKHLKSARKPDPHSRARSMSVGQLVLPASPAPLSAPCSSLPSVPDEGLLDESHLVGTITSSRSESDLVPLSPEEIEKCHRKRRFVLQELLETERIYVTDLGLLVEGYMEEIKQMASLPESMQGKDKIVFGNIHQIYDFHKDTFLPEIEKCLDDPHRLGAVFRRYERRLYMYVKYCENKPKSECVVMENEAFFEELRRKLNHKLQIADLLIKPVQRIMKYQLLLKEVHKFSKRCLEDCTGLDGAIEVMHVVPKAANDMMSVGRLQGFNGSITAQGKLLHQDKVTVVELGAKSDQKPRERHVFLFEQIIIFSEAVERKSALAPPCYVFKNALKVNKMSLENCGSGSTAGSEALRFMLVDRTPCSDLRLILQPADPEARAVWLAHINSMLAMQREFLTALQSPIAFQKEIMAGGSALPRHTGPLLTAGVSGRKGSQS